MTIPTRLAAYACGAALAALIYIAVNMLSK